MRILIDRYEQDNLKYGLPLPYIKKNFISLTPNLNGSSLKKFYLLEFHPCLASASRIPNAIKYAIEELIYYRCTDIVNERLSIEQSFFNDLLEKMESFDQPGCSFAAQIQKEVYKL